MVLLGTRFAVSDNSGAKSAICIKIQDSCSRGTSKGKQPHIGSTVLVSIKQVKKKDRGSAGSASLNKGSLHLGVLVEMKKQERRKDGSSFACSRNSIVLLTEAKQPLGTRILGLVPYEVRQNGLLKLLSLATYIL